LFRSGSDLLIAKLFWSCVMGRTSSTQHLPLENKRLKRIGYIAVCTLLCSAAGIVFLVVAFLVTITSPFVLLPQFSRGQLEDPIGGDAEQRESRRAFAWVVLLLLLALGVVALCYWQAGVPGVLIGGAILGGIGGAVLGITIVRGEEDAPH
jgi:hypothetical protein